MLEKIQVGQTKTLENSSINPLPPVRFTEPQMHLDSSIAPASTEIREAPIEQSQGCSECCESLTDCVLYIPRTFVSVIGGIWNWLTSFFYVDPPSEPLPTQTSTSAPSDPLGIVTPSTMSSAEPRAIAPQQAPSQQTRLEQQIALFNEGAFLQGKKSEAAGTALLEAFALLPIAARTYVKTYAEKTFLFPKQLSSFSLEQQAKITPSAVHLALKDGLKEWGEQDPASRALLQN